MIGKTISHYRILEKLGEGGMGVVYKTEDTKLKRTVALKFLTPQALGSQEDKTRFFTEAQAAASLDHPNICTIHEIDQAEGQTFIAMAYVQGQNLKDRIESGPLRLTEALAIALQVAEGLQEAHEKGIVHRDIKSANIMLTEKGQTKIMDFGLAKLAGGAQITTTETTMGTAAYMSPEQAKGEVVDRRTDIWSLGVLIYEMTVGQRPFKGDYDQAVVYSILNEEPVPITALRTGVPVELEMIVNKALAKSPDQRYQHADELIVDLRRVQMELTPDTTTSSKTAFRVPARKRPKPFLVVGIISLIALVLITSYLFFGVKQRPMMLGVEMIAVAEWQNSIAVLPFRDLSPKKDQEYFCDGMTEAIIGKLTGLKDLKIISMTSAMRYKSPDRDIKKIGDELGVSAILEGSIQKEDKRIRVNAQLINVADDAHLWSQTYDRELKSIFAIQDDISQAIVDVMKIKLLGKDKSTFVRRYTDNLEAYNAYVQGRFLWNKRTEEHLMKAIEYFKKAIQLDSNYALAYAGLADAYSVLPSNVGTPLEEVLPKAKEAALKALKLDDKLAEAHASLGLILGMESGYKETEDAEKEFVRAIELNPGYAYAHYWYSIMLDNTGKKKQGLKELEIAYELNPLSVVILTNLASKKGTYGDTLKAKELFERAIEIEPQRTVTYTVYVVFLRSIKQAEEAIQVLTKTVQADSAYLTTYYNQLAYIYNEMGDLDKAIEAANKLIQLAPEEANSYDTRGDIYALNGKLELAIKNYEKAVEKDPNFATSSHKLTQAYLFSREYPKAEEMIKKAMTSENEHIRTTARTVSAFIPIFQGKFEQALSVLDEGIQADRKEQLEGWYEANKHNLKLFIYLEKNDLDQALNELEALTEIQKKLDPEDPIKLRNGYAVIWVMRGQFTEADQVLRSWRQDIDEKDLPAMREYWRVLGFVELIKGNAEVAIAHFKRGIWEGSMPLFPIHYFLGLAYLENDQPEEAVKVLDKVILRYDEARTQFPVWSVKAHYTLGLAYQRTGQNKEAIEQYQEFLNYWKDADPDIPEVEDAKSRLSQLKIKS